MKNILLNLLVFVAVCTISSTLVAQAPNLGRASTFALFTSAGAFNNTGATNVTGDVGTQVGAFTGFPPGTLTGTIYVADSVTALAATDLGAAYSALSTVICDSTIAATMGSGQLLTPKVYCITTLATLTGNLILDGGGDTNALFIFKINGALSTATFTTVTLINGASVGNIYWQVNGAFTLGDNSVFRGNVLAAGAITLLSNASLIGRGLTISGAIALNTNMSALPVKLQTFQASCSGSHIQLNWSTAAEYNNQYFVLETSMDEVNWKRLTKMAGAGNSAIVKQYSYTDVNVISSTVFYRLLQVDFDGKSTYSSIVKAEQCTVKEQGMMLYPNPSNGILNIQYEGHREAVQSVSIFNFLGTRAYYAEGCPAVINLSNQPNGIYFVHVQLEGKMITQKLVLKNE